MTVLSTIQQLALGFADVASALLADGEGNYGTDAQQAIRDGSDAFKIVERVFQVIGLGVVVWTAKGVISALVGAKYPEAAKKFIGGVAAAVLCFRLSLPLSMVDGIGNLLEKVFSSFNNVLKDQGNG